MVHVLERWTIGGVCQSRIIGKRSSRRHHIKRVGRGLSRWQRLDAGRWCDGEAERARAGAAGRGKTHQHLLLPGPWIRAYAHNIEVISLVASHCLQLG